MTPERWAQIEELFHRAVECDPKQRASLLEETCNGDSELRSELEALLAGEESASDHMQAAVRCGLDAMTFPLVGEIISHYRILDGLGGGGMGSVYRAEDVKLGRQVALKFLPEESTKNLTALHRFEREARSASALEHPNICPIYEFGEHEGQPFLAMQLLKGQTLRESISTPDRGRVPLRIDKLLDLAIQIASGLEAAHSHGIIHRDIKPANIFVTTQGQAIILDFGLAKLFNSEATEEWDRTPHELATGKRQASWKVIRAARDPLASLTGAAIGTAGYMSPEQARGERLDARTDLFSFGAVLYEMATGQMAFFGDTAAMVNEAITERTPTPLTGVNPDMPSELERIVNKALEKERKLRYQSATEIRTDLQRLKSDADFDRAASTTQIESKPAAKSTRFPWVATTVATALIIALVAGGRLFFYRNSHALADKDTIILADFTNETGDPVFDHTLREGLAVELEQSPFFSLTSEDRIHRTLRLMDQAPNSKLTREIAREVCQRTGSSAVLDGSIAQIGSRYLLTLKAINCFGGESLASTEAQASDKNHVLDALGKATSEMRKKLGESLSSVQRFSVPLEQATTPSLDALQAYSAGVAAMRSKGEVAALPLFKRAVNLDPNFAIAYVQLALVYFNLSEMALAAENAATAHRLRGRATERERLSIDARFYDLAVGDIERAMQVYEQWKQVYPQDDSPYLGIVALNADLGRYGECLRDGQQAHQLDPEKESAYLNLIGCNLALDRLVEVNGLLLQAQDHKLEGPFLPLYTYLLAFRRDDAAVMEQAITSGSKRGTEHFLLSAQSDTKAFHGQLNRARELSRLAVESALRDDAKESAAVWHLNAALREAEFGNVFEAKRHVKDGLALVSGAYESAMGALALARAGDPSRAERIVKRVGEQFPNDTVLNNYWLPSVRAAVELNRKNSARAIDALHVTIPYALGQPPPLDVVGPMYPIYLRGEAYLMTRNGAAAATEFETILKNPGVVLNFSLGALAAVRLARAYALQGETTKAKAAYQRFLTLWKDADPGIPLLKQAKMEYTKLQ